MPHRSYASRRAICMRKGAPLCVCNLVESSCVACQMGRDCSVATTPLCRLTACANHGARSRGMAQNARMVSGLSMVPQLCSDEWCGDVQLCIPDVYMGRCLQHQIAIVQALSVHQYVVLWRLYRRHLVELCVWMDGACCRTC